MSLTSYESDTSDYVTSYESDTSDCVTSYESDTSDCVTSYGQVIVVMRDASEILALHARTLRCDVRCKLDSRTSCSNNYVLSTRSRVMSCDLILGLEIISSMCISTSSSKAALSASIRV